MRIKLIEDLPMASSAELYQLSWVIERLLADPRRIVQLRSQLHTGQQIQYFVSVRPTRLDDGSDAQDAACAQRCGSSSSIRLAGCVGSRPSTSLR